jgi:hypothetical protein
VIALPLVNDVGLVLATALYIGPGMVEEIRRTLKAEREL